MCPVLVFASITLKHFRYCSFNTRRRGGILRRRAVGVAATTVLVNLVSKIPTSGAVGVAAATTFFSNLLPSKIPSSAIFSTILQSIDVDLALCHVICVRMLFLTNLCPFIFLYEPRHVGVVASFVCIPRHFYKNKSVRRMRFLSNPQVTPSMGQIFCCHLVTDDTWQLSPAK